MRPTCFTRLMLHLANLVTIAFFLLPLIAVVIGALQSEKSLQAETRSLLPPEWTLDNFRVILSGGAQKGAIFEQTTYLPDNVKKIYFALFNSAVIAVSVTLLTLIFAALSAYTVARLQLRWVVWLMNVNVFARFVPIIVLMIPLILNNRAEFMTLPVVIASLVGDVHVFHNLMMAICLLALAPSVLLVLLLRRFVVQGLSVGGVKG